MSIKAVIFDLDGTLLDTLGDLTNAVNAAMRYYQFPLLSETDVCARVGNGVRRLIEQSVPANTESQVIDDCLKRFQAHYETHLVERTHPYQGIPAVMEAFHSRGVRMTVLSNKYQAAAERLISHYFPNRITLIRGEIVGIPRKPDPTSTNQILSMLNVQADEVLYIGDSDVDMQTAKAAGITAIGALWGFRDRESLLAAGAEHVVEHPEDLIQLLDRLQLDAAMQAFERNGFTWTFCATSAQAADYVASQCHGKVIGMGGSVTLDTIGIYDMLKKENAQVSWHWKGDEILSTGDVFLTSANAISATGEVVNIDGACNRIAASVYGFNTCYVVCGINKLTPDLDSAMRRAREIAAPLNTKRLGKRTPCTVDGQCHDCHSPERICRAMTILMAPPSRMCHYEIVMVGENIGY
ncbi:MAG: HAD-IA family hydrolase [Butyricicoccus pullicaecorum]|nr:HAD-IA family hydrolase [Butyricicoccus pullicaecorum]